MPPCDLSRREFLGAAAFAAVGLPAIFTPAYSVFAATLATPYTPPDSPRATLNFNLNWKFLREDVPAAVGGRPAGLWAGGGGVDGEGACRWLRLARYA